MTSPDAELHAVARAALARAMDRLSAVRRQALGRGARERSGGGGTPLASTGTPVVAALAGLLLFTVGGLLTWARARV